MHNFNLRFPEVEDGRGWWEGYQVWVGVKRNFPKRSISYMFFYSTRGIAAISCHWVGAKSETALMVSMGLKGDFECVGIIIVIHEQLPSNITPVDEIRRESFSGSHV